MPCSAATLARLVAAPDPAPPDAQLLRAFAANRVEAAFAELVRRHGPMVLATCRRVLGHAHDAEDAFQAVFLVLARKANTVRGNLAGWLYAVAVRTARGVRVMRDRRRRHETIAASGRREPAVLAGDPELAAVIDEELAKLPEHYREALVLCELRGLSRKEAATELGIPEGTLSSRLAGAKRKLAARLSARGLATPAVLLPILAPAVVSAGLVRSAVSATRGAVGSVAGAAASAVLKGMLFDQLKVVALAAGVLLAAVCGTWAMTGAPGGNQPAPTPRQADPATGLAEQLGSPEFADREEAAKKLRELGTKAQPALRAALKSDNPEVRDRAAKVLGEIRADAREVFAKQFDPKKTDAYDHPVWKRYVAIASDSPASRELFARIIANKKWLRTLDDAEANPAAAGHVYRVGVAEIFRDFHNDPAKSPPWPCDRPEEVAYLLLLGSYADDPGTELTGDEVPPKNLRNTEYLGRGIIRGEAQITHARGLAMGLQGELLDTTKEINRPTIAGPPGTDRVFAKLLAAWLARRPASSGVVPNAFRIAAMQHATEILPIARRYAANDFDPKRDVPPLVTITALELIAQLGTRADLPLFEKHFGDETNVAAVDPPRGDGTRDYYRPLPVSQTVQMRDVVLGLALLLYNANPQDFGFVVRKDTFTLKDGRYTIPWSTQLNLGFDSEERRTAAFKKAKEWLAQQPKDEPKKEEPQPDPAVAKLVEQLGSPEFANREAAQKALRELGLKARSALRTALKSENPEIRKRATETLAAIRKDRLWVVFAKVAGEDKAAQDLFAKIIGTPRAADAIEAALDDPSRTDELYRNRTAELMRVAAGHPPVDADGKASVPTTPDVWAAPPPSLGDIAGWMFLGTLQSGAAPWREVTHEGWEGRLSSHVPFLPEDDYTSAKPIAEAYEARDSGPLKKLTAAWLAKRRENDMLRAGLTLAVRYDIADAVSAARVVLRDPKPTEISPPNLAAAAIFLGLHGTKDDLPLMARHAADDRLCQTFLNLPPGTDLTFAPQAKEGRDLFCHVRDAAVVAMCKLGGKNPADFGFPPFPATKHPNGKPMSLASATKVGFKSKADRAAAFEKAAEWLKSWEPPAPEKAAELWPHFAKVVGDDKAARELFDLIVKNPKNLELLDKAAAGDPDLLKLYRTRRDELNKAGEKSNPDKPGTGQLVPLPLDDIAGWLLLGTFPATKEKEVGGPFPHFLWRYWDQWPLGDALRKGPVAAPLRKLVAAWLADRGDEPEALRAGFDLALGCEVPGALDTARRVLKEPLPKREGRGWNDPALGAQRLRGYCLVVIGKYGSADDIPLLVPFANDASRTGDSVYANAERDKFWTTEVRDVAVAMMIELRGGLVHEFGFLQDVRKNGVKILDPFYVDHIGFASDDAREAGHKKALEWLDKKK